LMGAVPKSKKNPKRRKGRRRKKLTQNQSHKKKKNPPKHNKKKIQLQKNLRAMERREEPMKSHDASDVLSGFSR